MIGLRLRTPFMAWATALWAVSFGSGAFPAHAARRSRSSSHVSAAARAEQVHLHHLAAEEKAAWREHLAKLRHLPPHLRYVLIRHDHRYKHAVISQHDARLEHLARLAGQEKHAWHVHLAKLRVRELHARQMAQRYTHQYRLAALQLAKAHHAEQQHKAETRHSAALHAVYHPRAHTRTEHDIHLAQQQAAQRVHHLAALHAAAIAEQKHESFHDLHLAHLHAARLAQVQAHELALTHKALLWRTRLAKHQAIVNGHRAAQRAHWVALHGDGSGGRDIRFWQTVAAGVPVKCITVNLNNSHVKVSAVMSRWGDGTSEPFRQMIARADPNVAVTGTFFSLGNLQPVGDIVIDGSLIHFGGMGTALCITPHNHARMVDCQWGRHHDWSPYDFVVACGPRLLHHGDIVLDPAAQRFHDRNMFARNSRIAVGITRGNKIVFVMTHKPIYLGRLAKVMRAIGVSEAMNLDAGVSTGLYYNGAVLASPGRRLTNMIVVYGKKRQYERALPQLIPAAYRRMSDRYLPRRVSLSAIKRKRLIASR